MNRFCPDCWYTLKRCGVNEFRCEACDLTFDIEQTLDENDLVAEQEKVSPLHEPTHREELEMLERWNNAARSWST